MIKYTNPNEIHNSQQKSRKLFENQTSSNFPPNHPPRRANPNLSNNEKLYIAIIDTEYVPSSHQCELKKAWIDDAYKLDFVDGIEIYSNVSFYNSKCSITSVSFPTPPAKFNLDVNPSCIISINLLHIFLNRSRAGWLLLITDSSFVISNNLKKLINSIKCTDPIDEAKIAGLCTEMRDYFQIFNKNSGMLLSRKTVEKLISEKTPRAWNVSCEIEIDSSEAIAHVLDINSMYAIHNDHKAFLGNPFTELSDYTALISGNFNKIPICPLTYKSPRVCHPTVQWFSNLTVWSAVGKHMNKYDFIKNAKQMIKNAPESLMFKYNSYESDLCFY